MMDTPERAQARFPPSAEAAAREHIEDNLRRLCCDEHDIGITQGAAGGDLLFAEACEARNVPLQLMLPLPEDQFIDNSILPSSHGAAWQRRYLAVKARLRSPLCIMPAAPGDVFERCNRWMLSTAAASGAAEFHLICLWNGDRGDGPGGTAHMIDEARRLGAAVHWIDARTLG